MAHGVRGVQPRRRHAGPDHIDAVERRFRGDPRRVDLEGEAIVVDLEVEMLGHCSGER